jgi:RNA polymerase sigma factor (sigma-70 family)
MNEQELIAGLIDQDRNAIRFLVSEHRTAVIKTACYFVGNMEDAEDISQEVFIGILRSIRGYRGKASLGTWIYRITVNRSLDFLKKKKRKEFGLKVGSWFSFREDGHEQHQADLSYEDRTLASRETGQILEKAIASLPENQKVAFILNKYDELPCQEIARIMNVSLSSVESLIHRAKMNLQKKLAAHFTEYSSKTKNHGLPKFQEQPVRIP